VQDAIKARRPADDFIKAYRLPDKYKDFLADPVRVRDNTQAIYRAMDR
jgi:hypothetical protein